MGKKQSKKWSRRRALRLLSALDQYARAAHAVMGGAGSGAQALLADAVAWLGALGYRFPQAPPPVVSKSSGDWHWVKSGSGAGAPESLIGDLHEALARVTPIEGSPYCPAIKESPGAESSAEAVGDYLASLPVPSPGLRERMESWDVAQNRQALERVAQRRGWTQLQWMPWTAGRAMENGGGTGGQMLVGVVPMDETDALHFVRVQSPEDGPVWRRRVFYLDADSDARALLLWFKQWVEPRGLTFKAKVTGGPGAYTTTIDLGGARVVARARRYPDAVIRALATQTRMWGAALDDDIAEPMVDLTKVEDAEPDPETPDLLADLETLAEAMGWTDLHRVKGWDGVWRVHGLRANSDRQKSFSSLDALEAVPFLDTFAHGLPVLEWLYDHNWPGGWALGWPKIVGHYGKFLVQMEIYNFGKVVDGIAFRDLKPQVALICCIARALRAIERLQTDDATPSPEPPKATPSLKPFPATGYISWVFHHLYEIPEGATQLRYRQRRRVSEEDVPWTNRSVIVHPSLDPAELLARWNKEDAKSGWEYQEGWEENEGEKDPEPEEALGR